MENNLREPLFPRRDRPSFFSRAGWKIKDTYIFLKNIPSNILMICQWIPILWNNWDWDYNYLLDVMSYKMQRMSKHILEHDHITEAKQVASELDRCVELIKQVQKGDFVEAEQRAHEEKWGETHYDLISCEHEGCKQLDIYSPLAREQGKEEEERQEQHDIFTLDGQRLLATYEELFNTMKNKIMGWWD